MSPCSFLLPTWKWGSLVKWDTKNLIKNISFFILSSVGTDSTAKSNISDDSEEDENESSTYMDNDNKNFSLCQLNNSPLNIDAPKHDLICHGSNDNNQIILSYHSEQPQNCMSSDPSTAMRSNDNVNKSLVVSSADTFSNSHENQCHFAKSDNNSISLNYFLMDVQLQMNKMNDFAQMELKIEIQKLILEKLRKPENLKNE